MDWKAGHKAFCKTVTSARAEAQAKQAMEEPQEEPREDSPSIAYLKSHPEVVVMRPKNGGGPVIRLDVNKLTEEMKQKPLDVPTNPLLREMLFSVPSDGTPQCIHANGDGPREFHFVSKDYGEHKALLEDTFNLCAASQIKLHPSECKFATSADAVGGEFKSVLIELLPQPIPAVTARHILVKEEAKSLELKARMVGLKGEELVKEFASLAKEHSMCPSGKREGQEGSLGRFFPGTMVPEFDQVCWTSPVGEVVGPVKTMPGFHLILIEERFIPKNMAVNPALLEEQQAAAAATAEKAAAATVEA